MESFNSSNESVVGHQAPHNLTDARTIVFTMLSLFALLGSFGNAMVIFVYCNKKHKLASTVFIITLAYIDFFTCCLVIPFTIAMEHLDFHVNADFVCKLYMFLITSIVPFSAFVMTAIAVDRYLCICHPLKKLMDVRKAKIAIVFLGLLAVVLGLLTALNYGIQGDKISQSYSGDILQQSLQGLNSFDLAQLQNDTRLNDTFLLDILNEYLISHETTMVAPVGDVTTNGLCHVNKELFSELFTNIYQKIYSSFFFISVVAVIILYVIIYRFVALRRERRSRQKTACSPEILTQTSVVLTKKNSTSTVIAVSPNLSNQRQRQERIRDKVIVANARTAAMLFAVTFVFIVVFLPAWLMAHRLVEYNIVIFYLYFFYNVANPIIYAFMNKTFRRDLRIILEKKVIQRMRTHIKV